MAVQFISLLNDLFGFNPRIRDLGPNIKTDLASLKTAQWWFTEEISPDSLKTSVSALQIKVQTVTLTDINLGELE